MLSLHKRLLKRLITVKCRVPGANKVSASAQARLVQSEHS
jgi:hypothetical protein